MKTYHLNTNFVSQLPIVIYRINLGVSSSNEFTIDHWTHFKNKMNRGSAIDVLRS